MSWDHLVVQVSPLAGSDIAASERSTRLLPTTVGLTKFAI